MADVFPVGYAYSSRTSTEPAGEDASANRRSILRSTTPELTVAALRADAIAQPGVDLAETWQMFIDGDLRFHGAYRTRSRHYVLARTMAGKPRPWAPLNGIEAHILSRVLCGEAQKAVAAELGIACSTTSKWFTQGLEKLNIDRCAVPLPLVAAAQSWKLGRTPAIDRRSALFDFDGGAFWVLSASRPHIGLDAPLTASERAVAQHLVEGDSRRDIAAQRSTSAQTVAGQIRAIFSKLGLRGRFSLIRRAADLGWLH